MNEKDHGYISIVVNMGWFASFPQYAHSWRTGPVQPERPGGGTGVSGKAEICVLACGRLANVLLFSAKSQKSRQSQESVQVGPLHNRKNGRADLAGKRPNLAGNRSGNARKRLEKHSRWVCAVGRHASAKRRLCASLAGRNW